MNTIYATLTTPLQQTRAEVFQEIFVVFLGLGTLVGVVVVAYILYNAYKYRDVGDDDETDADRPVLGELPTGGTGGKKLFLSFILSAIIVVSLIIWTYGMLLYVEDGPDSNGDAIEIDVEGQQFSWSFDYQDQEASTINELVVPADRTVEVTVTSRDVWHAFGIPQERAKADAIPGEYDETWFIAQETGEYENGIECFEHCGDGHSGMKATLIVIDGELYDAIAEENAMDVFLDGLDEDLTVDSSPEEFQEYLETVEEEEEANNEDGEDQDGEDGGADDGGNETEGEN